MAKSKKQRMQQRQNGYKLILASLAYVWHRTTGQRILRSDVPRNEMGFYSSLFTSYC